MCLVLANVGYFLWAHGIAKTPGGTGAGYAYGGVEAGIGVSGG